MTLPVFRCVDLETTGMDGPPKDEVLEIGWTDLVFNPEDVSYEIGETSSILFSTSSGEIPPATKGVHHITEADVDGRPVARLLDLQRVFRFNPPMFVVAHNAAFEQQWLTAEVTGGAHWICTEKVARQIFKAEAPDYKLQTLRYWLDITLEPDLATPPHRAGPDSYVNAYVLGHMLCLAKANDMVRWTKMPKLMMTCPIGDHYGKPWAQVPHDFLTWMLKKDFDADLKWNVEQELDRRRSMA